MWFEDFSLSSVVIQHYHTERENDEITINNDEDFDRKSYSYIDISDTVMQMLDLKS